MKLICLFLLLFVITNISLQKAFAQNEPVSFQIFYDELSPYGTWVETSDYGTVWVPDAGPNFSPYATNGYWAFTEDGWTWVSDFSWGWAPFHYGRWYTDPMYGPMWVPGYEWSPGWVTWRRSDDYYGWAPLGPGISISLAFGNGYYEKHNHYTFIGRGYFGRRNMYSHYANRSNDDSYYRNSTYINNTREDHRHHDTYHGGPDRADVEKKRGKAINPVTIKDINKPGQSMNKRTLQIYRPQVQNNPASGPKPAPRKVESLNNVKPVSQRTPIPEPIRRVNQPVKQNITQPQQKVQTKQPQNTIRAKQPRTQQQHTVQPAKQQPRAVQPVRQQRPQQKQRAVQPAKQQQQPQHKAQPPRQQAQPPRQQAQPPRQQAQPPRQQAQPPRQQAQPPKQESPTQNTGEEKTRHI